MRRCHLLSAVLLLLVTFVTAVAQADVKVPPVFSDHMVLQRDMAAPVWGTAEAGEKVVVSIDGQSHEAKADADGKWNVKFKPLKAGGPHVLSIKGANTIELKDVLVGDVWIGSGQSNMAGGVRGYAKGDEVLAELAAGTYPQLRFCRGKGGTWQESNPQANAGFSAILFAFGQRLQKDLDVPVGLILKIYNYVPIRDVRATCVLSLLASFVLMPCTSLNAQQTEPRTTNNQDDVRTADVIVYGSTPGGFCAAIAAACEGASVILLEPTDHVGAMSTGGLSHCDSNQMARSTLMGLFDEWHTRVVKDYTDRGLPAPYNPANKDQARWTFEPHVAMRVTMQMLDEAGVTVLTERYLKSVTKDGPRITSLVTEKGTFTARVFVDGTYEGDLMAAAGVDWTIGREGREEYDESLAGKQYPKPKMNINGFDDRGKLLPLVTSAAAADNESGDKNVMTYSFRLCLTENPDNRVPMPKPANYDPAKFEIVRRALQAGERRIGFDLYPMPGKKLDGNNSIGGQFSIGVVGGGKDWHSANQAERKKIWEAHKQYTLEFYHFLTTDPAVPKAMQDRYARLGLCKDEFANYDHFSPALYVRESRRMKGLYVISQKDILESPQKDDPIAISSFPIDSHDCQRIALKDGGVINEGTIFPVRRKSPKQGYAYHVPYRSILPKPEQCDNLLVPVALSCTHVGISSLRIEGAWMVIGQGAGVAAALAADQDVPVQKLAYKKLRERLLAQGQVLELPDVSDLPFRGRAIAAKSLPGIVLDDAQAKLSGTWSRSTNFKPYIEDGYIFCGEEDSKSKGDGKTNATFRFKVRRSGRYEVLMAYSAHPSRAKRVPMVISSGADEMTFAVDQTKPLPSGKQFRSVTTVDLRADVETVIQITNADTTGFVILDALQLLPVESKRETDE